MRIYVPNVSSTKIGGGWTFLQNFQKSISKYTDIDIVDSIEQADLLFAFSPTTIDQVTVAKAKALGKKFVLRMDGIPEDSRNSGKGTIKLTQYSKQADVIIYQTQFVKRTVGAILRQVGITAQELTIYNGVDQQVFSPDGDKLPFNGKKNIFHIHYRKDPNKRYEEVVQMYRELWTIRQDVNLVLLGRYPTVWEQYRLGFFNGEYISRFAPTASKEQIAAVMRSCQLFFDASFADPSPNVILEAMACGLPIMCNQYGGGAELQGRSAVPIEYSKPLGQQVSDLLDDSERLAQIALENKKTVELCNTLEIMANEYKAVFESIT